MGWQRQRDPNTFLLFNLQVRSQLEEDLGGQDLTSRKDEINGIIKQVMDEMDDDEDDEDEDGGGDDDGSDFDPGSEEDNKKKKKVPTTLQLKRRFIISMCHVPSQMTAPYLAQSINF